MKNWQFKGIQSFNVFEIVIFFSVGVAGSLLFLSLSKLFVDIFLPMRYLWSKSTWYSVKFISLFAIFIFLPIAKKLSKKKIGLWSISIQDSTLHISFKQKEWIISIEDIHSINFIEVHYGEDNRRSLHIHYQGKKLKVFLPEKAFMPDISASDFEAIDDFFLYIQKSGFFVKEKVTVKNLVPENISKSILLTK